MTIAANNSRDQYTATSGQTVFAYTFEIFDSADIVVVQGTTVLTESTHYTVSGVGENSGGNVTLVTGATAGDIITLYRDMDFERTVDYQNAGDFLAQDVNDDFDRLWIALQQINSDLTYSVRFPLETTIGSAVLPAVEPLKYIRVNALGTGLEFSSGSTQVVTADISYNNTGTNLSATNVQAAITELDSDLESGLNTVTGLYTAADTTLQNNIDAKQDELDIPSQAEAEAGTATTKRAWTAERVKQAIESLDPGFHSAWTPVARSTSVWYSPATDVIVRCAAPSTGYYTVDVGSSTSVYKSFGYKASSSNGSMASAQFPVAAGQYYRIVPTFSTAPTVWETQI